MLKSAFILATALFSSQIFAADKTVACTFYEGEKSWGPNQVTLKGTAKVDLGTIGTFRATIEQAAQKEGVIMFLNLPNGEQLSSAASMTQAGAVIDIATTLNKQFIVIQCEFIR